MLLLGNAIRSFSRREIIEVSTVRETQMITITDTWTFEFPGSAPERVANRDKLGRDEAHEVGILSVLLTEWGKSKGTRVSCERSYIYDKTIISHTSRREKDINHFIC